MPDGSWLSEDHGCLRGFQGDDPFGCGRLGLLQRNVSVCREWCKWCVWGGRCGSALPAEHPVDVPRVERDGRWRVFRLGLAFARFGEDLRDTISAGGTVLLKVAMVISLQNNFGFRVIGASMDLIVALDESQGESGAYCLANYFSSQKNWKKVLDAWAEYLRSCPRSLTEVSDLK